MDQDAFPVGLLEDSMAFKAPFFRLFLKDGIENGQEPVTQPQYSTQGIVRNLFGFASLEALDRECWKTRRLIGNQTAALHSGDVACQTGQGHKVSGCKTPYAERKLRRRGGLRIRGGWVGFTVGAPEVV